MRRKLIFISAVCAGLAALSGASAGNQLISQSVLGNASPSSERPSKLYQPDEGFVPDKETAVKIAEAVWLPIYGKSIDKEKPFSTELIEDSIWVVTGTLPKGHVGGVAYIEILKRDGRILGVIHGK